jgi:hypothetical protein
LSGGVCVSDSGGRVPSTWWTRPRVGGREGSRPGAPELIHGEVAICALGGGRRGCGSCGNPGWVGWWRDFQRVWEGPGVVVGGPELSIPGQLPWPGWGNACFTCTASRSPQRHVQACVRTCVQVRRSRVRTCVRLCAGILRPPPPSAPFGWAASRMGKRGNRNETPSVCGLVRPELTQELFDMPAGPCGSTGLCFRFPMPVDLLHHPEGVVPEELHAMFRLNAGCR